MANTAAQAFEGFKAKLMLTDVQQELVSGRRNSAAKYLADAFGADSDLPLSRTELIGSAARNVIIRPIDDIDVMAVFANKDQIFDKYRTASQSFLYRIRNALNDYRVEIVGARGQAVRLFYKQPPHVDIAPVFKWSGEGTGYALPDGSGGWLTTDPDQHKAYMAKRNTELSSRLKPMVRMLKRWNNEHSKRLRSFHLEVMVSNVFTTLDGNSRVASMKFFELAPTWIHVHDPAGHGGDLASYLTAQGKQLVISSFASALGRATQAVAAEQAGNQQEAIRLWRLVFGSEFPAFG